MPTTEEKLLAILEQPDVEPEACVEDTPTKIGDLQRQTLQGLLEADMPSPEEIIRDAKMAQHNEAVRQRREADLAKRRERRAKNPKKRRRRR